MKSLLSLSFLFIVFVIFLAYCKKASPVTFESIIGKWNIQKDSTSVGVGSGYHQVTYIGQPYDYFNFTSDGHIYTKENSVLDTFNYTISSGVVIVQDFGDGEGEGQFQSPSAHSMIIKSGYFITPGGIFGRTVYLIR